MYLPISNLDDGAKFEQRLAAELRDRNPTFDRAQVDLSPFTLRAKIDCMTISRPSDITNAEIDALRTVLKGSLARPNDQPRIVTIHDPTVRDLRYLLIHHPTDRVQYLEVAVDAHLPDGSNDLYLLRQLKEQIRHCLAPQLHVRFKQATRLFWDLSTGRRAIDAASNLAPLTSLRYEYPMTGMSVKVYIKTRDHDAAVQQPFVRVELGMRVTDWAGLDEIHDLPIFAKNVRTFCAPAFRIVSGFKNNDEDGAKWAKCGAAWDLENKKGLGVRANAAVNRAFGGALNDLKRSLERI